jgi:hypothetical protein
MEFGARSRYTGGCWSRCFFISGVRNPNTDNVSSSPIRSWAQVHRTAHVSGYQRKSSSLTEGHLEQMGLPLLLPTPPFTNGEELDFDPISYANFAGYDQKYYLLKVQKAIIRYVMKIN